MQGTVTICTDIECAAGERGGERRSEEEREGRGGQGGEGSTRGDHTDTSSTKTHTHTYTQSS